jgi:glutaminyl-peptide cyclotransferase
MRFVSRISLTVIFFASLVTWHRAAEDSSTKAMAVNPGGSKRSTRVVFDGDRAFHSLEAIVQLGPRPSGSDANFATQRLILQTLQREGIEVEERPFVAATPRGPMAMNNLIAKIPGASSNVVILGGHYDTKLLDSFRFVGANDGGSSAAFLLEMARVLKHRKNRLTYWCVFFDGEEAVREWTDADSLYGSRHFVGQLKSSNQFSKIKAMVLVDMIGDRSLNLLKESNSTAWLVDVIWSSVAQLGFQESFLPGSFAIGGDDHFSFLEENIPAVDLIDFDYGPSNLYWHSEQDTVDKCSPRSLQIVGETLLKALPLIEDRLGRQ